MPEAPADPEAPSPASKRAKPRVPWRNRLRSLHRDFGFFAVGLTIIYATSGLAVNHIGDWNPSFSSFEHAMILPGALPADDDEAAQVVLAALEISDEPADVYALRDEIIRYEVEAQDARIEVQPDTGEIHVTRGDPPETQVFDIDKSLPDSDWEAAIVALQIAGIDGDPSKVGRVVYPIRELTISFERSTVVVEDLGTEATVYVQGEKPRFFLYVANWLHLNRGKAAWTYIADFYAVVLIFLAVSGMLMVKGRQGLFGRGGIFLLIGIAVPVLYIIFAGP